MASVDEQLAYFQIHKYLIISVAPIAAVLVTLALSLRVYVRAVLIKAFGVDDWLLVAAYIVLLADLGVYLAIGVIELDEGIIGPDTTLAQLTLTAIGCYLVDQMLLKMSLAVFFLRVVKKQSQRYIIYVTISIYTAFTFAFFWVALFQDGTPIPDHLVGKLKIPLHVLAPLDYTQASLNIVVDLIFTATPIYVVSKAMMPQHQKISVCLLIGIGALGSVASIGRIPLLSGVLDGASEPREFYASIIKFGMVSFAETALGMIAISLATLRPLFSRCLEHRSTKSKTTSASNRFRTGITRKTDVNVSSAPGMLGDRNRSSEEDEMLDEDDKQRGRVEVLLEQVNGKWDDKEEV